MVIIKYSVENLNTLFVKHPQIKHVSSIVMMSFPDVNEKTCLLSASLLIKHG